jgi:hypothetical protein
MGVNLVAALGAFWALTLAAKPADRSHHDGYFKAEYGLSGLESVLIVVAAFAIIPDPPIVQGRPLTLAWSPSRGPEAAGVSSIRGAR